MMGRKSKRGHRKCPTAPQKSKNQLPAKEAESSSSDEASNSKEPKNHASSSGPTQANTFIVPKANTLIIGNLSENVNEIELRNFLQVAGDIVDIRLATFEDGTCRGFAQVEFATAEIVNQACYLSGSKLMGKAVTINFGHERRTVSPNSRSLKKPHDFSYNTILVRGFDASCKVYEIDKILGDHFFKCGTVRKTSIPLDAETGASTGSIFMEFSDRHEVLKALGLNGSVLNGFCLHVEKAT